MQSETNALLEKQTNLFEYFGKIKLFFPMDRKKKIINDFLKIKDNNESEDHYLMIDASLKLKDFEECKEKKKELVLVLEKEIKEVLFRE